MHTWYVRIRKRPFKREHTLNANKASAVMNIGTVTRRHVLWVGLNLLSSIALYSVVAGVCLRLNLRGAVSVRDFALFLVALSTTIAHSYLKYNRELERFGSTGIKRGIFLRSATGITWALLLGSLVGVCVHHQFHQADPTISVLSTLFDGRCVVPMLSACISIYWLETRPCKPWPLQDEPQPIFRAYFTQIVESVRTALPQSALVASSVSGFFLAFRTAEGLYFPWLCSQVTGTHPVCGKLALGSVAFPIFVPASSVWVDWLVSFTISLVVMAQLHVLQESLSYMSTYPMDFQKLQTQLAQTTGAEGRAAESSAGESLLVRALLIGLEGMSAVGAAVSGEPQEATGYAVRNANAAAEEQNRLHAQLVASAVRAPYQPAVLPYFGEVVARGTSTAVAQAKRIGKLELISRALAFQDLHRVASGKSPKRRSVLFAKHWRQVATACCGMMDATSIQVLLLDEFITEDQERRSTAGSVPAPLAPVPPAAAEQRSSSFENIVKLRSKLSGENLNQRQASADVPIEKTFDARQAAARVDPLSELGKQVQCAVDSNRVAKSLVDHAYLRVCAFLDVPVPGRGVEHAGYLPVRAIPPMCAATAVYAIQAVSLLLVRALVEDASGAAQQSVYAVLRCLLHLDETVSKYCSTLQASQFVRIASMGRTQEIRYRARSESAVPDSVRSILQAAREATLRVVSAYRDILLLVVSNYDSAATSAMFSRPQLLMIEAKLIESGGVDDRSD